MKKNIIIFAACFLLSPWAQAELLAPQVSHRDGNRITTEAVGNFDVEIEAPDNINAYNLLDAIPVGAASTEAIIAAVDKARRTHNPNQSISLSVKLAISKGQEILPYYTSGYVSLVGAYYFWNRAASYGNAIYVYNVYANTVTCFLNVQAGGWYPAVQRNDSWHYYATTYSVHTMYATGKDGRKGCWWQGRSHYNQGNFVLYFFS
jgi:hypothetical protein